MGEDRYAITIAMGFLMAVVATTAVLLRFKARRVRKLRPQADDWAIVAALVCLIGQCVCNLVGAFAGRVGTHASIDSNARDPIHIQQKIIRGQVIWVLQLLGSLGPGLTRASILLFYRRIFVGKSFQIGNWTIFGLNILWTFGFFFANLLGCLPISANWSLGPAPSTCAQLIMIFESMVVSDVILDGLVLTIPWYPVWHLNMPLRRKFTVCGIFLLGAFVCLFGIFRVFAMFDAVKPSADRSYSSAAAFYWATIETGIGILSACLPLMRPLIQESGPETLIRSVQQKLKKSLSRTRITSDGVSSRRPSESEYSRAEMISLDNQAKSFDVRKHGYQQGAQ